MARTRLAVVVAVVLAMGLLVGAQKSTRGWEYARLQLHARGLNQTWSWLEPGVSARSDSIGGLCSELGAKTTPNRVDVYDIVSWAIAAIPIGVLSD